MNVIRYVVPLGKTAADYPAYIHSAGATVYIGLAALRSAMHGAAGSAPWYGDTVVFVGAFVLADSAAFPCAVAAGTGLGTNPTSGGNSIGGPQFGDNTISTSKASGVTFDLRYCTMDFRGAGTDATKRAMACLALQGEDMTVVVGEATRLYPPNYNYLQGGVVASSGSSRPEEFSLENCGILVHAGAGNKVLGPNAAWSDGVQIDGEGGYCRFGVLIYMSNNTANARNRMSGCDGVNVRGANMNISVGFGGYGASGSALFDGSGRFVTRNRVGRTSWGGVGVNNGGVYGGLIDAPGNCQGATIVEGNVSAEAVVCQDAIQGIATGAFVSQNVVTVGGGDVQAWINVGSGLPYELQTYAATGNGVKMGLTGYTGTPGSTWLSAGTPGGTYSVAELGNVLHGNTIIADGIAISTNGSPGQAMLFNRVRGKLAGLSLSGGGNHYVVNNYAEHDPAAAGLTSGALVSESTANRAFVYNNILKTTSGTGYDIRSQSSGSWSSGTVNARNILVNGRSTGMTNYTLANDINGGSAVNVDLWSWARGWPADHPMRFQGAADFLRDLRSMGADMNIARELLGNRIPVGPF